MELNFKSQLFSHAVNAIAKVYNEPFTAQNRLQQTQKSFFWGEKTKKKGRKVFLKLKKQIFFCSIWPQRLHISPKVFFIVHVIVATSRKNPVSCALTVTELFLKNNKSHRKEMGVVYQGTHRKVELLTKNLLMMKIYAISAILFKFYFYSYSFLHVHLIHKYSLVLLEPHSCPNRKAITKNKNT